VIVIAVPSTCVAANPAAIREAITRAGFMGEIANRLEASLASSYEDTTLGIKGDKKARVYREAAMRAGEPPEFLLDVLDGARKLLLL
jgi:hypothetical protein